MANPKPIRNAANFGVAWQSDYGYIQAIQIKDTIYIAEQIGHEEKGNFVAPAAHDAEGRPIDYSQMEHQFRQTYLNAKTILSEFGAELDDVVEENVFVLDVPAGFAAAAKVRKEMYGTDIPQCASMYSEGNRLTAPLLV